MVPGKFHSVVAVAIEPEAKFVHFLAPSLLVVAADMAVQVAEALTFVDELY